MKVIVLGGGVIGVTTAYSLARSGAEVVLVDRQPGPALETSFANAGQVSPGYSTPWAAPGIPLKALKWMFQRHAPLAIRPDGTWFQWQWMAAMLGNCTASRYQVNKARMMRVAEYSRDTLRAWREDLGLQYEQRTGGTLQVFRTQAQLDAVARDTAVLQDCGVPFELLDRDGLARAEPGLLHTRDRLTGGLRLPNDETGDCQQFTTELARKAARLGVQFMWSRSVQSVRTVQGRIAGVVLDGPEGETVEGDQYVMCMGSYSRAWARQLGIDLPVYPVKGYSLTIPLVDETRAPVSTVLDETYKVALTRFDQRIRVGGMAELGGFDLRLNPKRRATLEMVANDLFPGGDLPHATFWTGLRPMTPDGTPIIGETPCPNLWLNTGHGTLGWTMACGSAQLVSDLVLGQRPQISTEGLSVARYTRGSDRPVGIPPRLQRQ